MQWNYLHSQQDIDKFMSSINRFHDSCLKELNYISGAYVDENLDMCPINSQRCLDVVFQTQLDAIPEFAIRFEGLKYLKLIPCDESYTCEIFGANMFLKDDMICWYDSEELYNNADCYGMVIYATKAKWRCLK